MARLRLALPLALLALVVAVPTASAATETKIVAAEMLFEHGPNPDRSTSCSAVVFIRWTDQAKTVATRVFWTTAKGEERSQAVEPPYNDFYNFVRDYQVAAGYHWSKFTQSSAHGPNSPGRCQELSEHQKTVYKADSARVELSTKTGPSEECIKARKAAQKAKAAYRKAQTRYGLAKGKEARAKAKADVAKAYKKLTKANARAKKLCAPATR